MNTFITPQFSYCPLLCIIHSQTLNNQINKIYEKALRLVYKDEKCLFFTTCQKAANITKKSTNPCDRDLEDRI